VRLSSASRLSGAHGVPAPRAGGVVPCIGVSARGTGTPSAPWVGMKPTTTTQPPQNLSPFPFQKLEVYIQARELAAGVHFANIGDVELRDQATRAAKSVFLNLAEGLPDSQLGVRRRHFCIARNSLCEVAAAVDLAAAMGALPVVVAGELVGRIERVGRLLGGLLR
jgi:four helix bundle protein